MKKRLAFVSNSSSSSYVCCICKEQYSGMDVCLSDVEMVEDELGFTFCESHLDEDLVKEYVKNNKQKLIEELGSEDDVDDYDLQNEFMYEFREKIPKELSPIYTLDQIPDSVLLDYMLKDTNRFELAEIIRSSFKNMDEVNTYLES